MRVFLVSHSSANTTVLPSSRIWYINLNLTFKQMGVQLLLPSFDVAEQHLTCVHGVGRIAHQRKLVPIITSISGVMCGRAYKAKGIDLFLSYYYSASMDLGVIE